MVRIASEPTIQDYDGAARKHALLIERTDAARWAIAELKVDPYLALSHAVWPTIRPEGSATRYAD
jgi:hypothetical protein